MKSVKIVSLLANFESSLETNPTRKQFAIIKEYFKANPVKLGEFLEFNSPNFGNVNYVSLGVLIDSLNDRNYVQNPTILTRVLNILCESPNGLIHNRQLIQPIRVGYKNQDLSDIPQVIGGNHRSTAILLAFVLSGHNLESELVRNIKVKVDVSEYTPNAVLTDNGSRSVSSFEGLLIKSSGRFDVSTAQSIIKQLFVEGEKPKDLFKLAFVNCILADSELLAQLKEVNGKDVTSLMLADTIGVVFTELKASRLFKMPTSPQGMTDLIMLLKSLLLPSATATKQTYSNLSRNYRSLAGDIRIRYFAHIKANPPKEVNKTPLTPVNTVALENDSSQPVKVTKLEIKPTEIKVSTRKSTEKLKTV